MSQKVDKLIRSVYPKNMLRRIKNIYKTLSPEGKAMAIREMKKSKNDIKNGFLASRDNPPLM